MKKEINNIPVCDTKSITIRDTSYLSEHDPIRGVIRISTNIAGDMSVDIGEIFEINFPHESMESGIYDIQDIAKAILHKAHIDLWKDIAPIVLEKLTEYVKKNSLGIKKQ